MNKYHQHDVFSVIEQARKAKTTKESEEARDRFPSKSEVVEASKKQITDENGE